MPGKLEAHVHLGDLDLSGRPDGRVVPAGLDVEKGSKAIPAAKSTTTRGEEPSCASWTFPSFLPSLQRSERGEDRGLDGLAAVSQKHLHIGQIHIEDGSPEE